VKNVENDLTVKKETGGGRPLPSISRAVATDYNKGNKRRFGGLIVPPDLSEDQLLTLLGHEYATRMRSRVGQID
jgi:hypothetical protein